VRGLLPQKLMQYSLDMDAASLHRLIEVVAPMGALIVALLMVSAIPFPHVTKQVFRGRRHVAHLIQVLLAVFVILLIPELALVLLFWIYALGVPLRYALLRGLRKMPAPRLDEVRPQ